MLATLLMAVLAAAAQEPVQVEAALSSDHVSVGETTVLTVTVVSRGGAPQQLRLAPLPRELDVLGTSDFTETRIGVPGGRVHVLRREVVIAPRSRGMFRIPPATVMVQGTAYTSQPLLLTVSGAAVSIGPADDAAGAPGSTALRVTLFPDTVFVGQQVLLHAEVTFAEHMRTRYSRPPTFDPPAPSGFWVQDLPDPVTVALRVREGRTVESQTFRRAYFPLSVGAFAFPPAHLHYEVRRGFLSPAESRRISSDSAHLVVLPLPPEGQPNGFAGAVGQLQLRASLVPERVAVGDASMLTVELRGRGNMRGLPQPALHVSEDLEVFPPTQEAQVEVESDIVGGVKRFRWVLVPEKPGALVIPPIEYSVFDPELRQYVILRSDTLRLHAAPAVAAETSDTSLRPLRDRRGREAAAWTRSPLFAALQVVPVLLVGAGVVVRRRRERPPAPRQHEQRLRAELAALRQRRDDGVSVDLERLLHEAVRCLTEATGGDPVASLRLQGRAAAADSLEALLADLHRLRYAPEVERGSVAPLFDRAARLIDALAPVRRWRARAAAGAAVIAAAVLLSWAGGHAQGDEFDRGVRTFLQGDYSAAANSFQAYVRANPADPHGWYNLGLAAHQAGDRGRAVWAWLRGLRLAPRDADLRHNLRLTAPAETSARVSPPDRLAAGERILIAAAAWWLLVLALGFGGRRRRLARTLAGFAAACLAAVVISLGVIETRPTLVTPLRDGAELFAGPSVREHPAGRLEPGHTARLLERRDDWLLVRFGAGREAWIERSAVAGL
jgi:tetratricopeptide (TPR) repeat protein